MRRVIKLHCFVFALVETTHQMVVTWMTFKGTDTVVEYGKNKLTNVTRGNVTVFSSEGHTRFIHRVTLENLEHGQKYCKWDIVQYMCQVVDY